MTAPNRDDRLLIAALVPPLAARMYGDSPDAALQRLILLVVALAIAYAWAALFTRRFAQLSDWGLPAFALMFVVLLPGPVGWVSATLAISFGAVFGREIFGGHPILPPAMVGLAFAIFSFPGGGFEARGVLAMSPDLLLAASCLPGAAILALRGSLAWQVAAGAVAGAAAAGFLMGDPAWWRHPGLGGFVPAVLFLAAAHESAVESRSARWLQGIMVGALIVVMRLANPDQPDGAVFAALLGALFAPLLHRALTRRARHG